MMSGIIKAAETCLFMQLTAEGKSGEIHSQQEIRGLLLNLEAKLSRG